MQDRKSEDMARKRTRKRSKQRSRRRRSEGKLKPQTTRDRDQWTNVAQIYQSLFEWHHQHVMSLCHPTDPNQDQDNEDTSEETASSQCLDYVYESSSEEEEEEEPIDEEYLKFLEVTIKHQQELKDRRAAQTADSVD